MESPIQEAVIEFYRGELRARYQLENVRRFEEFEPIADEHVDGLRDFFLEALYPPVDRRQQLDDAFERLHDLLRSPKRLRPLVATALTSVWRLGRQFPAAVSAGITTVDALRATRKLEEHMMTAAERLDLDEEDIHDRMAMLQVLATVPEEKVISLIHDVMHLCEQLSNLKMLSAMLEIMEHCQDVMEKRSRVYSDEEREGLAIGLETLRGGHSLFMRLRKKDFPHLIAGIEAVEMDWYHEVVLEAEPD